MVKELLHKTVTPGSDSYLPLLAFQNNTVQDCKIKATEDLMGKGPKLLPVGNLGLLMPEFVGNHRDNLIYTGFTTF